MAAVDLGGCVSFGWQKVKSNLGFHIVSMLVIGIGGNVSFGLLTGPLMVGYIKALMKEDAGGKAEIGDLFASFDKFVPSLIVSLVLGVVMAISSILIVGPLLIAPMMMVGLYLVAKGESDGIAAIKSSWEHYKSQLVMGAVTMLVLGLIAGLGAIACGVGMLITGPIAMAGGYKLALQITGDDAKANLRAA